MLSKKFDFFFKRSKAKAKAKTKYQCEQCDKEYLLLKPLQNHYKSAHNVEFKSIKHQIERIRNDPVIRNEEMAKQMEPPEPSPLQSAAVQSKPSRSYSIVSHFICSKCRIEANNHRVIRKHIEKYHKGDHEPVTIRMLCDKCWISFPTKSACKQHQWDKHIKDDQVEFPGTCCEFGCMKKYADTGGLTVHYNRHVQLAQESGEQWKESIRQSTQWNCQFGCLDKCDTMEQLIEMHNKHGRVIKPTATATSETQMVVDHKDQGKSESTKVDTTKKINININQFNGPQQSMVVEMNNNKAGYNISKQNTVANRPKTKYSNNVYIRNREIIQREQRLKHYNRQYNVDYRAQFGQHRSCYATTLTAPPKISTDRDTANK